MKKDIHPKYYLNAKVTCACGNTFETGSSVPELQVDICSACHPFFTGEMRFVDTQGRVEKFQNKMKQAEKLIAERKKKIQAKKLVEHEREQPKTLKEMLTTVQKPQETKESKPATDFSPKR